MSVCRDVSVYVLGRERKETWNKKLCVCVRERGREREREREREEREI